MNPYAKGLSNAVLGQSAPTSAGKVSTHFNSPYMKAISQNLMTAIYGSPQDELTRQQIAASKMSMQQTQAEMDASAAQGEANAQLGSLLANTGSYDELGNLTPEARAAGTQLSLAAGMDLGSMFVDTGAHGRNIAGQNNQGDIDARATDQKHQNTIDEKGLDHGFATALANMNHRNTLSRDTIQNGYTVANGLQDHTYRMVEGNQDHANNMVRDNSNNAFQGGQNDLTRQLTATTSAANAILGNQTDPAQAASISELYGIEMGGDLAKSLSEIQPNVQGIKPNDFVNLLDTSSEILWKNLGLDSNNKDHKEAFAPIAARLAAELQRDPNNVTEIISKIMSQVKKDGDDIKFEPYSGFSMDRSGQ